MDSSLFLCSQVSLVLSSIGKSISHVQAEVQIPYKELLRVTLVGGQKKLDYSCDWKRDLREVESPHRIRVRNDIGPLPLYIPVPRFKMLQWIDVHVCECWGPLQLWLGAHLVQWVFVCVCECHGN